MKILQVIPYFFVHWAGGKEGKPVETVYGLSKALVKRGHEVTVYTTEAFNKKRQSECRSEPFYAKEGIKVREFKSLGSRLGTIHHIIISPAMISTIAKEMHKFDVVHLHEYRTFQNIVAHHYTQKYAVPYVLQAHGSLVTFFQKGMLKRIFDRLWGYRILKDASKVIAVTKMEAEQYKSMGVGRDKIEVVPNGIDLSEFDDLPQEGEFRRKYSLGSHQRIILYLGRINRIKGLDLLVKAFATLPKKLDDAKLVIVGPDDGYLLPLKKLITDLEMGDKVLFTGPLYGREKLQAYVDADVYVLPSSYEIFSITVLEACACGTPVIVTDQCGIADVIDNQAGLAVPHDERQLQGALQHILSDDKMRQKFGEHGRSLVREKFSWEKIAEQVENIYRDVL
jgi:glycosyltransferase involved in cell wall biosynthesis